MTEEEDYDVELDLPPEWTDEELRGVKRFCAKLLEISHPVDYVRNLKDMHRTAVYLGIKYDDLGLPKVGRRKRSLPSGPKNHWQNRRA